MSVSKLFQVVIVFTGAAVSILVFPPVFDPINTVKLLTLLFGSWIGWILFISINKPSYTKLVDKLAIILAVSFIGLALISFLVNGQSFQNAALGAWGRNNGLYSYIALISLFLFLSHFGNIYSAKLIINSLTLIAFIFSIYAWLQYYKIDILHNIYPWYNYDLTLALTLGNSNFASVFLAFLFTASIGYVLDSSNKNYLRFITLLPISLLIGLVQLLDSQGQIIFALGFLLVVGFWLTFNQNLNLKRLKYVWWPGSILIGILGILGLNGVGIFGERLSDAFINLKDRFYHWQTAVNMMKDHLFFGVGIDNFGQWQRRYRSLESIEYRGTPMSGTDNAHNVFLQFGATAGLPLLIVYSLIILLIFWRSIVALRVNSEKALVGSLFSVWLCYQVQSLVSIDQIGLSIWNWIIGGALVGLSRHSQPTKDLPSETKNNHLNSVQLRKRLKIFLVAIIMSIPLINTMQAIQKENSVFRQLQVLPPRANSNEFNPVSIAIVEKTIKLYDPKLRMTVAEVLGKYNYVESALKIAEQTTRDFPEYIGGWEVVASIYEVNNMPDKAKYARSKTIELDPLNQIFKDKLVNK